MSDLIKKEDLNGGVDFRNVRGDRKYKAPQPVRNWSIDLAKPQNTFAKEIQAQFTIPKELLQRTEKRTLPMSPEQRMCFLEDSIMRLVERYPGADLKFKQYELHSSWQTCFELTWVCLSKKCSSRICYDQRMLAENWEDCVHRFFINAEQEIRNKAVELCYR